MKDLSNIKIVFCDIDGTLVDTDKNISNHTIESVTKLVDKGIKFILVSGRDYFHVMDRINTLNSSKILISSGGALIYDFGKDNVIYADRIKPENVEIIVNYCTKNGIGILLRALSGRYFNKFFKESDEKINKYIAIHDNTNFDSIHVCQILVMTTDKAKIAKAKEFVSKLNVEITNYSKSFFNNDNNKEYYFDVNNKNITKGHAITYLLEYLNIKKEDSLCFGDFVNDLDMFEACGVKVAMNNAHPTLKEKADFITDSNNEDGVANFIDKYLCKEE